MKKCGVNEPQSTLRCLLLYVFKMNKWMKSKITLPAAISTRNKLSVAFGFICELDKWAEFENVQKLPNYLEKFIS